MIEINLLNFAFFWLRVISAESFPNALSKADEKKLFEKMKYGDEKAREKLIEHNLRLVCHIIKKYYTYSGEEEDLISIGTIGLIKAIDSFDAEKGAKFATYAGKCVQNEILMYFRMQKKTLAETSMNETVEVDKDGNALTIMDILYVDDDIVDVIDLKNKTKTALCGIESVLDKREKEIIILRYGLSNKKPITQRECADMLGISRSYVSRIENAAINKLYEYMVKRKETETE